MPRPKRTKVASTAARVAKPPKAAEPPATRKQPTSRNSPIFKAVDRTSDDSDGLVVRSQRARRHVSQQPDPQEEAEFSMTGALPAAKETTEPKISSKTLTPPSRVPTKSGVARTRGQNSSSKKSPKEMVPASLRSAQHDVSIIATEEDESSGFGDHLLSFTSLGSESPAHGTRPPSAIKVGATPAHERSILALTNFKRRARQPSLLRMVHQTTDVEDNDLDDSDDLEDFYPNAESTPLPKQQNAPTKEPANDSGVNLSSSSSRGTKRKLSPVVQVPRSSPPYDPPSGPDVEESRSSSPSLPDAVRSTVEEESEGDDQEPVQPEIFSETMAPPMSSSDYQADEIEDPLGSPVHRARARRRAKSVRTNQEESEGEETDRLKQPRGKQKSRSNKGISTANLQALLPKRRTRPVHDDSDSASEIDSDQDELSMPTRRHTQMARRIEAPKPSRKSTRAAKKPAVAAKAPKNSRTYGRRRLSDKENEGREEVDEDSEESDNTAQITKVKPSSHLDAMAKKFEDIDAFDLDFESVSYVQTSSSPWR